MPTTELPEPLAALAARLQERGADPTQPIELEEQAPYIAGALDTLREAAGDPAAARAP
jgi:sirohydrochlorin ferrochelatase